MRKIFVTRKLPRAAKELLSQYFIVDENSESAPITQEKLREVVGVYDGILSTVSDKFTSEVLQRSGTLSVISNYAVGTDNIDIDTAKQRGIMVYHTPDVVTESTADLTFALLLSLIRKIPSAHDFVKMNNWKSWDPELFLGEELHGKTFGIIGFGRIGKAVAKRAIGFGLNVIYYNHSPVYTDTISDDDIWLRSKTTPVELNELLKESYYISIHVPLTDETRYMINASTIAKMEKKPVLLNISRGEVVDTKSLIIALRNKQIRGACLDVTDPEPLPGDHELCALDNCIIVPHIGTATYECRQKMAEIAAQNIIDHFNK
jgi:glyoxylate reductase